MAHTTQRHPELVSGSVRGERQEKARGEMLKQVQHDNATKKQTWRLKDAKPKTKATQSTCPRKQKERDVRLKDAKPKANSRGFLNPWKQGTTLRIRLEDGERQRVRGLESPSVLKPPSLQTD